MMLVEIVSHGAEGKYHIVTHGTGRNEGSVEASRWDSTERRMTEFWRLSLNQWEAVPEMDGRVVKTRGLRQQGAQDLEVQ